MSWLKQDTFDKIELSLIKKEILFSRSYLKTLWPLRNHISRYLITIVHKLLRAPFDITDNPTFLLHSYCSSTEERGKGKVKSPVHLGITDHFMIGSLTRSESSLPNILGRCFLQRIFWSNRTDNQPRFQ